MTEKSQQASWPVKTITLEVEGSVPTKKNLYTLFRPFKRGGGRGPARIGLWPKAKMFQEKVAVGALEARAKLGQVFDPDEALAIDVEFHKEKVRITVTGTGIAYERGQWEKDLDNMLPVILDGLEGGGLIPNDLQVVTLTARKVQDTSKLR